VTRPFARHEWRATYPHHRPREFSMRCSLDRTIGRNIAQRAGNMHIVSHPLEPRSKSPESVHVGTPGPGSHSVVAPTGADERNGATPQVPSGRKIPCPSVSAVGRARQMVPAGRSRLRGPHGRGDHDLRFQISLFRGLSKPNFAASQPLGFRVRAGTGRFPPTRSGSRPRVAARPTERGRRPSCAAPLPRPRFSILLSLAIIGLALSTQVVHNSSTGTVGLLIC